VVFEPNPYYYDRDHVGLKRLVFVMVENEFTEWTAYRRGEIDVTDGVHRSALATVRNRSDFHATPIVGTCYLCFNCTKPPFDRAEFRRAFALALDRRLLVKHITRGGEQPATALVPPGIAGNAPESDFRAEGGELIPPTGTVGDDVGRLRGLVHKRKVDPVYSYDATELQRSLAVALQMMWRDTLGIEVRLESMPARLLGQNKRQGRFMIARASWVADYLDATTFLDVFRTGGPNNPTGWSDPRYDALLDRAALAPTPTDRAALLHEAERLLIDEMPICPLFFYTTTYLQRPGLEGVVRNRLGRIDFSRARWE
jgi:ABC-type oligopeptide transport system substrate-binding subunit